MTKATNSRILALPLDPPAMSRGGHVRGYPQHAEAAAWDAESRQEKPVECAGLLMLPEEAGVASTEPNQVFCTVCSLKHGRPLLVVSEALFERAGLASQAAGVRAVRARAPVLGDLSRSARLALRDAFAGHLFERQFWGVRTIRELERLQLINTSGSLTEAGWMIALHAGWYRGDEVAA